MYLESRQAPSLGRLLRSLRQRESWTLQEMSRRTGIAPSTLSKVENDHLGLSYGKLRQLSERLEIPLSELFAERAAPEHRAVTARRSVGQSATALRIHTDHCDYRYLCTDLCDKRMIPVLMRVRARSLQQLGGRLWQHAGEEYVYVLEGRIEIHTTFYCPLVLEAGQSVYFDSSMGHAYLTPDGCEEASILVVCASSARDPMAALLEAHRETEI